MGLGLWARPSAMTRIPGKSFSPQYPKLLAGPLNFGKKIADLAFSRIFVPSQILFEINLRVQPKVLDIGD